MPRFCRSAQTATRTECEAVARKAAEYTLSFYDHERPFAFLQTEPGATFDSPGFLAVKLPLDLGHLETGT